MGGKLKFTAWGIANPTKGQLHNTDSWSVVTQVYDHTKTTAKLRSIPTQKNIASGPGSGKQDRRPGT